MSYQKASLYLSYCLKAVLFLTLLTPVLISSKYLFPFITTKTMFFRIMVEIAVVLYFSLTMIDRNYKPRLSKLSWAIIIFGVIIFLTGITGVDFYRTFWGTIERGEGFLTISHLIVFFLLLTWTLKSSKEWLNYLSALIGVGLLIDLYAILQRAQVENFFLFGKIIHAGEGRLSSTLGNAAFLGAFSLAQFFISILLFFKRPQLAWKITFVCTALINLYVLFQTQTRGAGLALAIVLMFASIFYSVKSPIKKHRQIATIILAVLILSSALILLNKNSAFVQNNNMLRRLVSISKSDITTESRLAAWKTSWAGWKDRFIFGYGWENYNIAFNKYFPAVIYKDAGSQLWFDRAHNTIFDVAVATGLIGLINYLTIFGLAFYYLFKNLKKDFNFFSVLIALLTAHFIQNIFVFDVLSTYLILFSVFALVNFATATDETPPIKDKPKDFNILLLIAVIVAMSFLAYIFNFKPIKANKLGIQSLSWANADVNKTFSLAKEAINLNTYQTMEIRQKLADTSLNANKIKDNITNVDVYNNYKTAIQEIKNNISEHPQDVQNHLYLMALLNRAASYDINYLNDVVSWGEQALKLSPTRPQIYFEMGQARISQGRLEEGINYFKKAVDLNSDAQESHWNLFAAYTITKQDIKAEEEYKWLENNGFDFTILQNLNRLYNIYVMADNKIKLVPIIEQIVALDPSANNYAKLAAVYREAGNFAQAKAAVLKAIELDPSLKSDGEKFLQTLK